jgi:hypothetical protein
MEKAEKSSPKMEQLIAENNMLKEENRVLKEENAGLSEVIEGYDRELTDRTDVLEKTTNKLIMVLDILEKENANGHIINVTVNTTASIDNDHA